MDELRQSWALLSIDQEITGDTVNGRVTIAHYTYDELGRSIERNYTMHMKHVLTNMI